jgi:hypothetical protein
VTHTPYTGKDTDASTQPVCKQGHWSSQLQLAVSEATINIRTEGQTGGTNHKGEIFKKYMTHLQISKRTAGKLPAHAQSKEQEFWNSKHSRLYISTILFLRSS